MSPAEKKSDTFFIGWQGKQPAPTHRLISVAAVGLVVGCGVLGLAFARAQQAPDVAAYAWSNIQTFDGILRATPYPHLLIPRPGSSGFSTYPLVGQTKFGVTREWCGDLNGRPVQIEGGLIYRDGSTIIEVASKAPQSLGERADLREPLPASIDFGNLSLVGEIVDAKCFTGAMNPGHSKLHRACATVCLSGGIPPMLVVNARYGASVLFLLVGPDGEMINQELLPHIARAVRMRGQVLRYQDLWVLQVDPDTIESL